MKKIKDTYAGSDISKIDATKLENLNFCLKGLSISDIQKLPSMTSPTFNGAVAAFGGMGKESKMLSMDQVILKRVFDNSLLFL